MKKDIEWLKNEILGLSIKARHKENNQREWHMGHEMALFDVNKLIDQLDEPDKPVIPQYVADWIEVEKEGYIDKYVILEMFMCEYNAVELPNDLYNYYDNNKGNSRDKVINAILDGYEVEKEQKYQVIIRDGEYIRLYLCKHGDNVIIRTNDNYIEKCPEVTYLTEQEIKDYDERYWAFAKEVTE